jgi:NDP-sugar pyrophosphorylase family protein
MNQGAFVLPFTAMILAAGLGTRLGEKTKDRPKPLVEACGKPLLYYILNSMQQRGVGRYAFNLHYKGDLIVKYIQDAWPTLDVHYSFESPNLWGTAGGIRGCLDFLEPGPFLLMNADTPAEVDPALLMSALISRDDDAVLLVRSNHDTEAFRPLWIDGSGYLLSIGGSPPSAATAIPWMYTGIAVWRTSCFRHLVHGQSACLIQDIILPMLHNKRKISTLVHDGYWNDCGTPERLADFERDLKLGCLRVF